MENARIAQFTFSRQLLRNQGFGKYEFMELLDALPEDTTLIDFFEDYQRDAVVIRVSSDEFKPLKNEVSQVPEIPVTFKRCHDKDEDGGESYVTCDVDLSDILVNKVTINPNGAILPRTGIEASMMIRELKSLKPNEFVFMTDDIMKEINKAVSDVIVFGTGFMNMELLVPQHFYGSNDEYLKDKYTQIEEDSMKTGLAYVKSPSKQFVIDKIVECNHQWKNYEGIFNKYDYCTLCDLKRN